MYRLVENFIEKNHMIQPEDTVLAGVSGGETLWQCWID